MTQFKHLLLLLLLMIIPPPPPLSSNLLQLHKPLSWLRSLVCTTITLSHSGHYNHHRKIMPYNITVRVKPGLAYLGHYYMLIIIITTRRRSCHVIVKPKWANANLRVDIRALKLNGR